VSDPPVLETPRLRLRPFASDDVDVLHAQWTDPEVRRHLWDGRVVGRDEVVAIVEESIATFAARRLGFWTLAVRPSSDVVGFVGLRSPARDVELYYGLAPARWGRGFATEASRAVLRYAFDVVGVPSVDVRADGPNVASIAVMRRLGARWVRTESTGAFGSTVVYVIAPPAG
jgi:RimJ/RimL family protein N-acetyltransferase